MLAKNVKGQVAMSKNRRTSVPSRYNITAKIYRGFLQSLRVMCYLAGTNTSLVPPRRGNERGKDDIFLASART